MQDGAVQKFNIVKDKNVNAARPKAVVNGVRPKAVVNAIKGNIFNDVKASACWVWKPKTKVLDHVSKHISASITLKKFDYVDAQGRNPQIDLQDKGVIGSGCSRYMIGNMSYLTDYEEIDAGYVTFGGNPKGRKITGRGKARMETVPGKDPPFSQILKSSPDAGFKPSSDDGKKVDEDSRKNRESIDQEKEDNVNSINNANAASTNEVNVVGGKTSIELPDDLNMPALEDIVYPDDDEDVGVEADPSWIEDMQDELLQFKLQKVWTLVDLPNDKEESSVNYQDLEDPVFLDEYTKLKRHVMMHHALRFDDIIFGSTKKSLCTKFEKMMHKKFQMSFIGELIFFLGLQVKQKEDGIFISQDKYVTEILKKFGFTDVKTVSILMETQKLFLKDEECEEVDLHLYRLMIDSLMYLTSLRPDIMFIVCACAGYQVNPKVSHLLAVKMIFRYLKGQPKLGLWYPKDSPFDLVAYTDSDYAGASLDRKSTTGETEYMAATSYCGQVLWIQNQLLDYGFDNQSIERDRLIGIGFVLDFVEFISFTFGDKEMILVIEAVSRKLSMSPLICKKFCWGTIFPIGLKRYRDPKEEPIEKEPLMELKGIGYSFRLPSVKSTWRRIIQPRPRNEEQLCLLLRLGGIICTSQRVSSMRIIRSSVKDKILAALCEASKVENVTAEMMRGLDQLMERKEDEVREDYKMEKLARFYIDEIVAGHGVLTTAYHPQKDGQSEHTIQTLEDNLRAYHSSIRCAPFGALSGRKCRLPVLWAEIGESRLIGLELVQETNDKVVLIKEKLKATRDRQKSYADDRRKLLEFEVADQVLLKVSPWKDKTLRFVEELVEIIDREVKSLKRSRISIVKVHWNLKRGHEDFINSSTHTCSLSKLSLEVLSKVGYTGLLADFSIP
ncbi:uncharacterized mitochondrial protein-like protein [Tanacetum coccineum]